MRPCTSGSTNVVRTRTRNAKRSTAYRASSPTTMDAMSTIRRLELPRSKDRIRDRFQELTRWAALLRLSRD